MSISNFDQISSAFNEFNVPGDSPLRDILRKPIPTYEAAHKALQEIAACFRGEIGTQNPHLVERVTPLLNAEIDRVRRAIQVKFDSQRGTLKIPESLEMLEFPIAPDTDLSKNTPRSIECTIDGQKVYLHREMIVAFVSKKYCIDVPPAFKDLFLGRVLEGMSKEIWQKTLTPKTIVELGDLAVAGVFLGDYTDRGANDIEILTLLLCLRMENPTSVHLIRGNHEDLGMQREYSPEGTWVVWHTADLFDFYESLPLALCVTVKDQSGRSQYVHFSHGAFSPAVDLAPLFESTGSGMVVRQNPLMTERKFETGEAAEKQRRAFQRIKDIPKAATQGSAYTWSDIGSQRAPSERTLPGETALGHTLSPEDIHEYGRWAGGKSPIKAFFMGHKHIFNEWRVVRKKRPEGGQVEQKKVIATTLPVGRAGGAYSVYQEVRQGILLQAAPKVKDWTKQLAVSEGTGKDTVLRFQGTPCGMYECLRLMPVLSTIS